MLGGTGKYDAGFKSWIREFKLNPVFLCDVTVLAEVLDSRGRFMLTWTLNRAEPDSAPPISSQCSFLPPLL